MEIKREESGNELMTKSGNLTLAGRRVGCGGGEGWGGSLAFILMNTGVLIPLQNEDLLEYCKRAWQSILPGNCHELRLMKG